MPQSFTSVHLAHHQHLATLGGLKAPMLFSELSSALKFRGQGGFTVRVGDGFNKGKLILVLPPYGELCGQGVDEHGVACLIQPDITVTLVKTGDEAIADVFSAYAR